MADRDGLKPASAYPEAIYLQRTHEDGSEMLYPHDATWTETSDCGYDIKYIRADIASPQPAPHAIKAWRDELMQLVREYGLAVHIEGGADRPRQMKRIEAHIALLAQPAAVEPAKPSSVNMAEWIEAFDAAMCAAGHDLELRREIVSIMTDTRVTAPSRAVAEPANAYQAFLDTPSSDCLVPGHDVPEVPAYMKAEPARKAIDAQGAEDEYSAFDPFLGTREELASELNVVVRDLLTASDLLHERWKAQSKPVSRRLATYVPLIQRAISELESPDADFDVRKILLDVVPDDDGMAKEIYAKNVGEVVDALTSMSEKLDALQASPLPAATLGKAEPFEWCVQIDHGAEQRHFFTTEKEAREGMADYLYSHPDHTAECFAVYRAQQPAASDVRDAERLDWAIRDVFNGSDKLVCALHDEDGFPIRFEDAREAIDVVRQYTPAVHAGKGDK